MQALEAAEELHIQTGQEARDAAEFMQLGEGEKRRVQTIMDGGAVTKGRERWWLGEALRRRKEGSEAGEEEQAAGGDQEVVGRIEACGQVGGARVGSLMEMERTEEGMKGAVHRVEVLSRGEDGGSVNVTFRDHGGEDEDFKDTAAKESDLKESGPQAEGWQEWCKVGGVVDLWTKGA